MSNAADDAREVEVTPSGTIREVPPMEATPTEPPAKATKLSAHTFGNA
jgi:hypothetical protein